MNYVRKILENIPALNTFETIDMTVLACERIVKEINKDKISMLNRIYKKMSKCNNYYEHLHIVHREKLKLGGGK